MKRNFLLVALLLTVGGSVFAASLPEPVLEYQELSLPAPVLKFQAAFASELWAANPAPQPADLPDLSWYVSQSWAADPDPLSPAAFLLSSQMTGLWESGALSPFEAIQFESIAVLAQSAASATDAAAQNEVDQVVLQGLLNNEYYRESLKLKKQADEAFEYGDYDACATYAANAAAAAKKSDEYVALRLKIRSLDETLVKAKDRLDWAAGIGAQKTYANRFASAQAAYDEAIKARADEQYDLSMEKARKVLADLADVKATVPLPARYKVRPWASTKDCFWTIAGYSWVYGNPRQWKVLYEANKAKLPQPDNPNLLWTGTVITIPSIRGEYREGLWEAGKSYTPLSKQ